MDLFIKSHKLFARFVSSILFCIFSIASSVYAENITMATVGASLTGGVSGYSPSEVKDKKNDNFIDSLKKKTHIKSFTTHLYPHRTLAKVIESQKTSKNSKVTVIDAFSESFYSCTKSFKYVGNIFYITVFLNAIFNSLSSLQVQITYARAYNTDIIIGLDMFFWSIYSNYLKDKTIKTSDDENYSKQLKQLDKILKYLDAPENRNINFVVGNIPYRSRRFFSYNVDPTQKLLDIANKKIANWAMKRNKNYKGKVLVINTTDFFTNPERYEEFLEVDTPLVIEDLVCTDGLHPSYKGQDLVSKYVLKTMAHSKYEIFSKAGKEFN